MSMFLSSAGNALIGTAAKAKSYLKMPFDSYAFVYILLSFTWAW